MILQYIFLTLICISSTHSSCIIFTTSDFGDYQPLLLKPTEISTGHDAFFLPCDSSGKIIFEGGEEAVLDCPGGGLKINGIPLETSSARISCISGKTFQLVDTLTNATFDKYVCENFVDHIAEYTGKSCLGDYKEVEIGFQLSDGRYLAQIWLCFDEINQNTIYSQCEISEAIGGQQYDFPRSRDFEQDQFYSLAPHPRLSPLYSRYVQRLNINRLVGLHPTSLKYIQNFTDCYISRGHLTARRDFIFGPQQNATFHYINVAPQWQSLNGRNWNELEISVRNFASRAKLRLKIYSGTYGITTLPHESDRCEVELFLYDDLMGRKGIPVPRLFWKVVYEPKSKAAVAFLSINNPYHYNLERDVICNDICDAISWPISWNRFSVGDGYSYCCHVDDFRNAVDNHLPQFEVLKLLN